MQVLVTAVVVGLVAHYACGLPGPAAIVIGNGLALSSTAVVLQVMVMSNYSVWLLYIGIFNSIDLIIQNLNKQFHRQ